MTKAHTPASARLSALHALARCLDKCVSLDEAWHQDKGFTALAPADRAFAQRLAKSAIRRLGQTDDLLARFLKEPLQGKAPKIQHILRLGAAQLLWLEIPPHAAVHESVELAKHIRQPGYSGLVNAVLKRVATEGRAIAAAQDAARLNTPGWLWDSWVQAYGERTARDIAEAHLKESPLDITVKENPEGWAQKLGGVVIQGSVRLTEAGAVTQLPGFAEGSWWVQDAAAALPARLLGDVQGKRVLDLCAAPGGKTAQLAAAGAMVTALDISRNRVGLLKENLARLHLTAECVVADALGFKADAPFNAILLDAPCSATGTLRRHPDVALNRTPEDIARLQATQRKLLRHALSLLAPGGRLVYAVCSLQPEEGEGQIRQLLKEYKDVTMEPVSAGEIGGLADALTAQGELRTLPCHLPDAGGRDGFYAARMIKTGAV